GPPARVLVLPDLLHHGGRPVVPAARPHAGQGVLVKAAARDPYRRPIVIALFAAALIAWAFAGPYTLEILTRLAIFVIFALSIDFLVGYTGLVTMGHAGFLGVGAYATAYFAAILNWPISVAFGLSILLGAVAAAIVGVFV